jgi:hypothetical protein
MHKWLACLGHRSGQKYYAETSGLVRFQNSPLAVSQTAEIGGSFADQAGIKDDSIS